MRNPLRRLTKSEFELLHEALRSHIYFLTHVFTEDLCAPLADVLGADMRDTMKLMREAQAGNAKSMLSRLYDLYHHDVPLEVASVPEEQRTYCLACRRRHSPHCASCLGCLPEELPE